MRTFGRLFMRSARDGARTSVYLASAPELAGSSGGYYADCQPATPSVAAQDEADAERLWRESARLTGIAATVRRAGARELPGPRRGPGARQVGEGCSHQALRGSGRQVQQVRLQADAAHEVGIEPAVRAEQPRAHRGLVHAQRGGTLDAADALEDTQHEDGAEYFRQLLDGVRQLAALLQLPGRGGHGGGPLRQPARVARTAARAGT